MNKVRVVFPIGNQYYMESPWVEIGADKARSKEPVQGQPQFREAAFVKEQVLKGNLVIDNSMSIGDCYTANSSGSMKTNALSVGTGQDVEHSQIKLTVQAAAGQAGVARIGLSDTGLGIFGNVVASQDLSAVGGTFGTNTLKVLGNLANYGFIRLKKIHIKATNEAFYSETPRLRTFTHTGQCQDKEVYYPLSSPEDDNPTIRVMDEKYLSDENADLTMNGKNFFEVPVPAGESANITLYTCFYPKS